MKKLSFFLMAMLISLVSFAQDAAYKTALFGESYNSKKISSYTDTWTATNDGFTVTIVNANNNNNAWGYIKMGRKNNASVGSITTQEVIDKPVSAVTLTIDALTASKINSLTLKTSTDGTTYTEAGTFSKATGDQTVELTAPAANLYYQIVADCASGSSNGLITISKVQYFASEGGEQGPTVATPVFDVTEPAFQEAFTLTITSEEGTTLKYTTDNTDPITSATAIEVATNTATVAIPAKSTVVKAVAIKDELTSKVKSVTYGFVNTPETAYTVSEAIDVINAGLGLDNELYAKGEIYKIDSYNSTYKSITYWIKDEAGKQLQVYSGRGLNNTDFASKDDLVIGTKVVICGLLKKYNSTYEFDKTNYIVSLELPVVNHTITVSANPAEAGTVTGDGEYEEGATATLTATPAEGYEFVCWTEGADTVSTEAEYGFVVLADRNLVANFVEAAPEINYEEFIMSNLVVTTPAEGLEMLEASDPVNGISVMLGVYEDGTLHEDCLITFQGMELSIVSSEKVTKEYNEDVETDVYTVRVVVAFGGANMGLQLLMYATAAAEPIIINVEGATVTLTEYQISAEETAYELNMISNWVYEEDGLTYEVECLLPTFDPTKESGDYEASFFVRGEGNAFGMTEDAIVSVAKNGNQITLTGEITAYNNNVYNVTISGTLPVVEPEVIAYELNGGELPAPAVPTNEELWIAFMPYYQEYYDVVRAEQPITSVAVFLSAGMGDDATIFTSEDSDYKWLGDYIIKVTTEQSADLTTLENWKFNAQAFFNANQYTGWPKSADFTEAGKPENWGAAYEAAHAVVLPTEPVAEDYVLPTPVKEGYTFVGWYDNAEGTGEAYTVIPAGWSGTLYAIWEAEGPATALDNIAIEGKVVKTIINGQLIIIKNGVQYNAQGQVIK